MALEGRGVGARWSFLLFFDYQADVKLRADEFVCINDSSFAACMPGVYADVLSCLNVGFLALYIGLTLKKDVFLISVMVWEGNKRVL